MHMQNVLIAEDNKILSPRPVRARGKHGVDLDVIAVNTGKVAMDVRKDARAGRWGCR